MATAGRGCGSAASGDAELYDVASGVWRSAGTLASARLAPRAARLASGAVLVSGGGSQTAEVFNQASYPESRRPVIQSTSGGIAFGTPFSVTGTGFGGDSEASGGGRTRRPVNYPLVQARSLHTGRVTWLVPDARTSFS